MPPDNRKAQYVTEQIRRLGVQDVQLFYDHQVKLWAVCQVKKVTKSIITLDNPGSTEVQPMILWWVRTPQGNYREPSDQDVSDMIAIAQRAEITWRKSESNPDWLDDQMLQAEQSKKEKRDYEQKERIKYIARTTNLKKHIQRELGEKIR